jgi:collagenase-like PrtC family protease
MMLFLNVGNRWNLNFLERIDELNRRYSANGIRIEELYGSIPGVLPTARAKNRLPRVSIGEAAEFIRECKKRGIEISYTANASCFGAIQDFDEQLFRFDIRNLAEIGVSRFTVFSTLFAKIILEEIPYAKLKVSTINRVWTVAEVERWLELFPKEIYAITLDHVSIKDIYLVRRIQEYCKKRGVEVEVLANEFCILGCPHRQMCYSLSSHDSIRGPFDYYPFGWCYKWRKDHPWEWIKSPVILPQELDKYSELTGVTHFKITGRTAPDEVILRITEAYMAKKWKGNLLDLWPQIHKLAGMDDLSQECYIDCSKLPGLVDIWERKSKMGMPCEQTGCEECGVCKRLWELAKR